MSSSKAEHGGTAVFRGQGEKEIGRGHPEEEEGKAGGWGVSCTPEEKRQEPPTVPATAERSKGQLTHWT